MQQFETDIEQEVCSIQLPKQSIFPQKKQLEEFQFQDDSVFESFFIFQGQQLRYIQVLKASCDDLRDKVSKFRISGAKTHQTEKRGSLVGEYFAKQYRSNSLDLNKCNLVLFGPSGAGKSSLIRTFFQSLKMEPQEDSKFTINKAKKVEGTKKYQQYMLKEESNFKITSSSKELAIKSSQINIADTRGHFSLNENEQKQIELILEGKVRNACMVEQRNYRHSFYLWEFWKKDSELFPSQIINTKTNDVSQIPHQIILVFDGSLDQVPSNQSEIEFYHELIQILRRRGYLSPKIVLTRLDVLEVKMKHKFGKFLNEQELRQIIDEKIEQVVINLEVDRSDVYFIENYHERSNSLFIFSQLSEMLQDTVIDYYSLKLLMDTLEGSERFVANYQHLIHQKRLHQCPV